MLECDGIVCVQIYPESGDQATVHFLNMAFAKASTDGNVQLVYTAVSKALKNGESHLQMDFGILYDTLEEKCWINPPCFLSNSVTIYESF